MIKTFLSEFLHRPVERPKVWLRDHDGEQTITRAYKESGKLMAKRWWPLNTRNVVLLDGGLVEQPQGSYVSYWGYLDE